MNRRDLMWRTFAASLLATAAGCGREAGDPAARAADVPRAQPPVDTPIEQTLAGMAELGYALTHLVADADTNVVVSPLSIAYAFAMVRGGARGETAAQLDEVFGFPADGLHKSFNELTQDLVTTGEPPPVTDPESERDPDDPPNPPIVAIANQLFPGVGLTLREAYVDLVDEHYGAGLRPVDFSNPEAAMKIINAWAKKQTAGRIKKVFEELSPWTVLVLANAVYLKADWTQPFIDLPQPRDTFTTASGASVDAPMLYQAEVEMPYAITDQWQAVDVPYAGGDLFMRIIIPTDETPPIELLSPETLTSVGAELSAGRVELTIPEWDFATTVNLVPELQELGLTAPFGPSADFSGIFGAAGPYITQAIHRANITVDKYGTEAAAVTAIAMELSAPPPPEATITADRPFAFAIMDRKSNVPLFIGQVADPTASD